MGLAAFNLRRRLAAQQAAMEVKEAQSTKAATPKPKRSAKAAEAGDRE